ncbi:MAG: hypothetical protein KUG62_07930 [Rhodobacteraceae bacterium]|nr:hypothetical protein [Paracoccaceae bacterium]
MNTEPYGTTIFCDDIRHETNGKLTLVGCYSSDLNFSGPAPGMLPVFAALVNIRIPKSITFSSLRIHVLKEEGSEKSQIFDAAIEITDDEKTQSRESDDGENMEDKIVSITIPIQWSPLPMKEQGLIKVRAYLDDSNEIRLGVLKINFSNEVTGTPEI